MDQSDKIIANFEKLVDERLETDDHKWNCMAQNEWSDCCLCNADDRYLYSGRRDKVLEFLRKALDNNSLWNADTVNSKPPSQKETI